MKTEDTLTSPKSWINVPVIGLVARILCRELVLQNEYLKAENRILKSKVSKRLSFTDDERRTFVDAVRTKTRVVTQGTAAHTFYPRHKSWHSQRLQNSRSIPCGKALTLAMPSHRLAPFRWPS